MENISVTVADNIIDKDLLEEIIESIIYDEDYSEELKLKIINALEQINDDALPITLGPNFYKYLF